MHRLRGRCLTVPARVWLPENIEANLAIKVMDRYMRHKRRTPDQPKSPPPTGNTMPVM